MGATDADTKQEPAADCSGTYQVHRDVLRVVFSPAANAPANGPAQARLSRTILFVLDRSGSMDSFWKKVQTAVRYMADQDSSELEFIVYDSVSKRMSAMEVLAARVQGCTNFEKAFLSIKAVVNEKPAGAHIDVVFMTDGHSNEGDLPGGLQMLKFYLNSCRRTTCLHTIGFSKGHDRNLLEKIRVMGSSEGVYRFCEGADIDDKFEELFDFLVTSQKVSVVIGQAAPITADNCQGIGSGDPRVDLVLSRAKYDPLDTMFVDEEGASCVIEVDGCPVTLRRAATDMFFTLRNVEEMEITSEADLEKATGYMYSVNPMKAPRESRREFWEYKQIVQDKLDKFHALFAEIARGLVSGDGISAQLNSLRHETTFAKARRARVMDKRTAKNIDAYLTIEDDLEALPAPDLAPFRAMDFSCGISDTPVVDVMKDTKHDFFVFPLRVNRPELAIDAPTQVVVEKFLLGRYSFDSYKESVRFALTEKGSGKALGGFTGVNQKMDDSVGLFRGADGEMTNACLPCFLHEDHWKRVEIQLKPILGYFFTMDPLGYKGDQMIALYMILGNMVALHEAKLFRSEFADWLLADFTKLCSAMRPLALAYLQSGGYTGRVRGDLAEEFIQSPANRTKEAVTSILVIVGWNQCTGARLADPQRFDCAFTEELWRRSFTAMFKGQPRSQAEEWIEKLLFLDSEDLGTEDGDTADANVFSGSTMKKENKEFSRYAKWKLGMLSKKEQDEAAAAFQTSGPPSADGVSEGDYRRRECVCYEERQAEIDQLVEEILVSIAARTEFLAALYDGCAAGKGFSGKLKWMMLIQAIQFSTNSAMNQAVANNTYKNTYDFCETAAAATSGDEKSADVFLKDIHERFEVTRKQSWEAIAQKKRDFVQAKKIALCGDLQAFTGRLLAFCPIRGGDVFANLVAVLSKGQVNGKPIPLLEEKIRAVMTGKVQFNEGGTKYDALANGLSWVHCSTNTAQLLREVVTEEQWANIEISMHGVSGWAYRPSDIPNRHGHHVSHPNPQLVCSFAGFGFDTAANNRSGTHI